MKMNPLIDLSLKKLLLSAALYFSFSALSAQEIRYTDCESCWKADSLGNHRVVVQFQGEGDVAKVVIPWRRKDHDPQDKRIIVEDARTGQEIMNIKSGLINREYGEI